MQDLLHELSILAKIIAYKNLSAASMHVGISQPHLSRVVQRLEGGLGLQLLERESKRKSGWTPQAYRLAETYSKGMKRLSRDLIGLEEEGEPENVRIGSLEGLVPLAMKFAHALLSEERFRLVELEVHDLSRLEQLFGNGDLDLAFTSREPGRRKFRHVEVLGYQALVRTTRQVSKKGFRLLSTFEFDTLKEPLAEKKAFVTNSLEVRKRWLEEYGGVAVLPSEVHARAKQGDSERVLLVGTDDLASALWQRCLRLAKP